MDEIVKRDDFDTNVEVELAAEQLRRHEWQSTLYVCRCISLAYDVAEEDTYSQDIML